METPVGQTVSVFSVICSHPTAVLASAGAVPWVHAQGPPIAILSQAAGEWLVPTGPSKLPHLLKSFLVLRTELVSGNAMVIESDTISAPEGVVSSWVGVQRG